MEAFSGPFPHPQLLDHYERLYPGFTERIVRMADSQAQHRQALEKSAVADEHRLAMMGVVAGATVSLAAIVGGALIALFGHPVAGAISGGAVIGIDIAGLAGVFIYGTQSRQRERIEKAQIMTEQFAQSRGRGQVDQHNPARSAHAEQDHR